MTPRKVNLFRAFEAAMRRNPDASRKEAFDYFLTEAEADPRYLVALADHYFHQQAANWRIEKVGPHVSILTATPAHQHRIDKAQAQRAEKEARITEKVAHRKVVLLMKLQLPGGMYLVDASYADLGKADGFYAEVRRHLKPGQVVGKHLTEDDLRNIWSRFNQRRTKPGATAERETRASA